MFEFELVKAVPKKIHDVQMKFSGFEKKHSRFFQNVCFLSFSSIHTSSFQKNYFEFANDRLDVNESFLKVKD